MIDRDVAVADWLQEIIDLGACEEAVEWARGYTDAEAMWNACERGDWMLWLAGKHSGEPWGDGRRKLVLAAMDCARLVLPIYEKRYPDDRRVRDCIDLFTRYGKGEDVPREELHKARAAAYAAYAYADAAAAAAYAAAAAANAAADAAYAAANAAADAAYAAYAASDAAYAAANAAADAANAAADAAYAAANAAADAAADAAYAAAADAAADAADAAYAARVRVRKECAALVRAHYPTMPRRMP